MSRTQKPFATWLLPDGLKITADMHGQLNGAAPLAVGADPGDLRGKVRPRSMAGGLVGDEVAMSGRGF
jgi:hypothetical protein